MIHHLRHHSSFYLLAVSVIIFAIFNTVFVQYSSLLVHIGHEIEVIEPLFFIGGLFLLGTICYSLSRGTIFPSFLVALFLGLSMHDLLQPLVENSHILNLIVTIAAVYILFGGGLEISFTSFKKIVLPTLLLSTVGLAVSTFFFAGSLAFISSTFGFGMSISIALLLGAILASTDPAAIIPVLKELKFKKERIKDIVVSESALTDVTGTLVTVAFIAFLGSGGEFTSISSGFNALASLSSLGFLIKEIVIGCIVGVIGFYAIRFFVRQRMLRTECHADIGFFIAIPIMSYAFASLFGGSGYLASFITGLLVVLNERVNKTETFFNQLVEGIAKPTVFIILGALVNIQTLLEHSLFGIIAGLLFIFVIRPVAVFISLGGLKAFPKIAFSIKELLFMSWVRETGVIPAVLLVQTAYSGLNAVGSTAEANMLISIGMWVIMMTLVIQPPLTQMIARKLDVAE
ncbi:MAG: cation:proton antiporter [Candidatus Pacebacteria bacterium]|nr:cation:proton antiporter [Candidatus Paceibacterota bacterium]